MVRVRLALLMFMTVLATTATAHEGGTHARGAVKEASRDRLLLAPVEGAPVVFVLVPTTRIRRAATAVGFEAIRVGERAVVHAKPGPKGLEATDVILGADPPARPVAPRAPVR